MSHIALSAAPPPLQVSLRAQSPKTIPGIPIDVRIVVTNPTRSEIELPDREVMLRVERAGQAPFWAFDGLNVDGRLAFRLPDCFDQSDDASIRPRGTVEYVLEGDPSGEKSWWEDPRLNAPGVYRLQVVFGAPDWAHGGKRPGDFLSDSALGPDALISKPLTVVVEEPHGGDAAVWEKLVTAQRDEELRGTHALRWADSALVKELLETYPQSRYAPWLAFRLREWGDADFRDKFRQKYGNSPLAEVLDLEVLTAKSRSLSKVGLSGRAQFAASVRTEMQALLKKATHPVLRCLTSAELERLSDALRNAPVPSPVEQ